MYWCKIARSKREFEEIAKLNYETFVEEIPQHAPHPSGKRQDAFHHENTYLVVLKDQQLIGMIALRDQRPFSLDGKIGVVEQALPKEALEGKLCEIRLLSVRKEYRKGRVFFLLARAFADYAYEKGYGAAVISGTVRELKLYRQLGFEAFADPVGNEEASFVPMYLTKQRYEQSIAARFQQKKHTFFPGPNELTEELKEVFQRSPISHRSYEFTERLKRVQEKLKNLSGTEYVHLLSGSGTLANEAMIAQISLLKKKGLILVNGAFGERLMHQAKRWNLEFDVLNVEWGQAFDKQDMDNLIHKNAYGWLLAAHGETSTGMLNDLNELRELCKENGIHLCLDCISSFGALSFDLKGVYLATGVSGKSIGSMTGLAFVFSNHWINESTCLPTYLDLGCYAEGNIPFTVSSQMLEGLEVALETYIDDNRYAILNERYSMLREVEQQLELEFLTQQGYPMIVTFKTKSLPQFLGDDARLSGFDLHDQSLYLKERKWVQMSIIQPNFEQSFEKFREWLSNYLAYEKQ